MKKYFIEVGDSEYPYEYILQSVFFNTEKEAVEWAKNISWLDEDYSIALMECVYDEDGVYGDIGLVRYLR